jgi:hypothetical protein
MQSFNKPLNINTSPLNDVAISKTMFAADGTVVINGKLVTKSGIYLSENGCNGEQNCLDQNYFNKFAPLKFLELLYPNFIKLVTGKISPLSNAGKDGDTGNPVLKFTTNLPNPMLNGLVNMTFSCWIKKPVTTESKNQWVNIIHWGNTNDTRIPGIWIKDDYGILYAFKTSSGNENIQLPIDILNNRTNNLNNAFHLAITHLDKTIKVYINGVLVLTKTLTGNITVTANDFNTNPLYVCDPWYPKRQGLSLCNITLYSGVLLDPTISLLANPMYNLL